MKKFLALIGCLTAVYGSQSQSTNNYQVEMDLINTANDQIPVTVYPPLTTDSVVEYHMPKIVPGTYSISDFGRFVTDFQALDAAGNPLPVDSVSTNRWKISTQGSLKVISYKVHDTRDAFANYGRGSDNIIFEPGGTEIDEQKPLFVMNTFGFIGYLDGYKNLPFEVTIKHDEALYGATALKRKSTTSTSDVFVAEDYNFLADGPIMYSEPDTVTKDLAGAKILVSVYSPTGVLTAQKVMDNISDLMEAQAKYLGGNLPVDRYSYLIIAFDDKTLSGAYGALEHSYSSLYYFPEAAGDMISQVVRDIAAHEFFHIVTPLNIHAEQIGDFNYIDPQMSEHLWLYEGVTEYSSMHVQVKHGLYDLATFLKELTEKMKGADTYPQGVSFTEMSRRILEPEYEPMYGNVYQKGALIAMCLDLTIIKYSNGEKDLPWLMQQLSKKYGKEVSFKDEDLFSVITEMTYPEVGDFLERYVRGSEPLPYEEVLSWVGVSYTPPATTMTISAGSISFALTEDGQVALGDLSNMNTFGQEMGLMEGDVLLNVNGMDVDMQTLGEVFQKFKEETKAGDQVYYVVGRANKKGKLKKKKLKAKAIEVEALSGYELTLKEDLSAQEQRLLNKWTTAE